MKIGTYHECLRCGLQYADAGLGEPFVCTNCGGHVFDRKTLADDVVTGAIVVACMVAIIYVIMGW